MPAGTPIRRWKTAAVSIVLLAGTALSTACDPQTDAQPTIATVDFEPRVVVTVDDGGIVGEPGDRDGAQIAEGDGSVDLIAPVGSVVDLHNDATGPRRILITRAPVGSADPVDAAIWLDTGTLQPGEALALGLSSPGDYAFSETATDSSTSGTQADLVLRITPRAPT